VLRKSKSIALYGEAERNFKFFSTKLFIINRIASVFNSTNTRDLYQPSNSILWFEPKPVKSCRFTSPFCPVTFAPGPLTAERLVTWNDTVNLY